STTFLHLFCLFFFLISPLLTCTLFPYTTLFRSTGVTINYCEPRNSSGIGVWVGNSFARINNCDFGTDVVLDAIVASTVSRVFTRSEEHTSELQSRENLVCRLLLETKNPGTRLHN